MFKSQERMFWLVHGRKMKAFEGFNGPAPKFPLGTLLDFARQDKQTWEVCAEYGHKYGPATLIWLGSKPALVLNDPHLIGEVLDSNWQAYYKDAPFKALLPVVTENSAFIANPPEWANLRESEPLSLSKERFEEWMRTQMSAIHDLISDHVKKWANLLQPIDITVSVQRVSFDAFTLATCGAELGDSAYNDFIVMAKSGTRRMTSLLPIPTYPYSEGFDRAHERWFARFDALVQHTRRNPNSGRTDLLAELVRQNVTSHGTVLRDGFANIGFGGVFSVTSGIVTSLYMLAKYPATAQRLHDELKEELGLEASFGLDALNRCKYLDCVLRETLRYLSPVPLYFRNVQKDQAAVLGGRRIPANTLIFITNRYVHRSPDHWKNPNDFDPTRWENDGIEKNPLGSDYFFPFGRGPRTCVGMNFAMTYMKLALAAILSKARVGFTRAPFKETFFFGCMLPAGLSARVEAE